ncbi:MAG: hypothetical protein JNL60_07625 [Bacteroidia bacterium]|nr:hypothetical protein [Bacteroidia bacterium]
MQTAITMNKKELNIRNIEDLEREERKVIKRIKRQEAELGERFKQLPEEIVTTGVTRLVTAIIEGSALKSLLDTAKKIGKNALSSLLNTLKS